MLRLREVEDIIFIQLIKASLPALQSNFLFPNKPVHLEQEVCHKLAYLYHFPVCTLRRGNKNETSYLIKIKFKINTQKHPQYQYLGKLKS